MQHAFGLSIPQTLEEVCHPARLALLVYDMQVGILQQLSRPAVIIEQVASVLAAAREGGYRIFFSRYLSLPNELAGVARLRMAMGWQRLNDVNQVRPAFLRVSAPFQLIPEMDPRPSEAIFDRISMLCFVGTPLRARPTGLRHSGARDRRRRHGGRYRAHRPPCGRPGLHPGCGERCLWRR